jgi:uncharacterized protein YbjT (DUF2867 family)
MSTPDLSGLRVGVVGASGYIGRRLVPSLRDAGATTRAVVRRPNADLERVRGVEVAQADALDRDALTAAFAGLDLVYWLVHSLGSGADYAARDREAAASGAAAAAAAGVRRIVYLGGLGNEGPELSEHLRSRHETAEVLAGAGVPVTTLRAAMIIGSSSASFRMLRDLARRLPVMVAPRWVENRTQPIAYVDVRAYLLGCAAEPRTEGRTLDIGGPDVLTYADALRRTARLMGLHRRVVVPVPVLTPELSSRWCGLVTSVDRRVARPLIEGLRTETTCRDTAILELLPLRRLTFDEAVRRALTDVPLAY